MPGLRDVIQNLSAREGTEAVAVVSGDGLIIDHASRAGLDTEAIAALFPPLAQAVHTVGGAASGGELRQAVLEYEGRLLVIAPLRDGHHLLLLAAADGNIGELLFDLERHGPALAELL